MKTPTARALRRLAFNLAAGAFASLLVWLLLKSPSSWQSQAICLAAAGSAALLAYLDDFQVLKGGPGGLEIVRRAEEATRELMRLAETVGEVLIGQMPSGRFLGGAQPRELDEHKTMILAALKDIGLSDERLKEVAAADRIYVVLEYTNMLQRGINPRPGSQEEAIWKEFWKPFEGSRLVRPTPDQMEGALQQQDATEPWRQALLTDYRHYFTTGEQRRPNIWAARDDWYGWTETGQWPG